MVVSGQTFCCEVSCILGRSDNLSSKRETGVLIRLKTGGSASISTPK